MPEAAERLGVSVYTVRRWIKDGRLKAFRPGKEYRIREADLEEFLAAREVRPKAAGRSSLEPSLLNGLEDERRATSLQSWIDLNNQLGERWEREIEEREREWRVLPPSIRRMVKRLPNLHWATEIFETTRAVVNSQTALLEDEDAIYDPGEVAAMYRSGMRLYGLLDRLKPWFDTPAEDAPGLAPVHDIRDALKRMEKKAGVRAS